MDKLYTAIYIERIISNKMNEDEFVDKIEAGKNYKQDILFEFLIKYNYHLYSKSISPSWGINGTSTFL